VMIRRGAAPTLVRDAPGALPEPPTQPEPPSNDSMVSV
jgi:hypothetical protein